MKKARRFVALFASFCLMLVVMGTSISGITIPVKYDSGILELPNTSESFSVLSTERIMSNDIMREPPPRIFLFDMSVKDINGLITTDLSGKSFKPMNLSYSYIEIAGELTNTLGKSTKVGTCFYSSNLGQYVADGYEMMPSGFGYTVFIKNNFREEFKSYAHYGYVNPSDGGYVSGSIRIYDSAGLG